MIRKYWRTFQVRNFGDDLTPVLHCCSMWSQDGIHWTIWIDGITIVRRITTVFEAVSLTEFKWKFDWILTWTDGIQIAWCRWKVILPSSKSLKNSPNKITSQSWRDNLVEPGGIGRYLIKGDAKFFENDRFVRFFHTCSMISDPLSSPSCFVPALTPWCWVRLQ